MWKLELSHRYDDEKLVQQELLSASQELHEHEEAVQNTLIPDPILEKEFFPAEISSLRRMVSSFSSLGDIKIDLYAPENNSPEILQKVQGILGWEWKIGSLCKRVKNNNGLLRMRLIDRHKHDWDEQMQWDGIRLDAIKYVFGVMQRDIDRSHMQVLHKAWYLEWEQPDTTISLPLVDNQKYGLMIKPEIQLASFNKRKDAIAEMEFDAYMYKKMTKKYGEVMTSAWIDIATLEESKTIVADFKQQVLSILPQPYISTDPETQNILFGRFFEHLQNYQLYTQRLAVYPEHDKELMRHTDVFSFMSDESSTIDPDNAIDFAQQIQDSLAFITHYPSQDTIEQICGDDIDGKWILSHKPVMDFEEHDVIDIYSNFIEERWWLGDVVDSLDFIGAAQEPTQEFQTWHVFRTEQLESANRFVNYTQILENHRWWRLKNEMDGLSAVWWIVADHINHIWQPHQNVFPWLREQTREKQRDDIWWKIMKERSTVVYGVDAALSWVWNGWKWLLFEAPVSLYIMARSPRDSKEHTHSQFQLMRRMSDVVWAPIAEEFENLYDAKTWKLNWTIWGVAYNVGQALPYFYGLLWAAATIKWATVLPAWMRTQWVSLFTASMWIHTWKYFESGIRAGLNTKQAWMFALVQSWATSVLERISPNSILWAKKPTIQALWNEVTKKHVAWMLMKVVWKELVMENVQEQAQNAMELFINTITVGLNPDSEWKLQTWFPTWWQMATIALITTITTSIVTTERTITRLNTSTINTFREFLESNKISQDKIAQIQEVLQLWKEWKITWINPAVASQLLTELIASSQNQEPQQPISNTEVDTALEDIWELFAGELSWKVENLKDLSNQVSELQAMMKQEWIDLTQEQIDGITEFYTNKEWEFSKEKYQRYPLWNVLMYASLESNQEWDTARKEMIRYEILKESWKKLTDEQINTLLEIHNKYSKNNGIFDYGSHEWAKLLKAIMDNAQLTLSEAIHLTDIWLMWSIDVNWEEGAQIHTHFNSILYARFPENNSMLIKDREQSNILVQELTELAKQWKDFKSIDDAWIAELTNKTNIPMDSIRFILSQDYILSKIFSGFYVEKWRKWYNKISDAVHLKSWKNKIRLKALKMMAFSAITSLTHQLWQIKEKLMKEMAVKAEDVNAESKQKLEPLLEQWQEISTQYYDFKDRVSNFLNDFDYLIPDWIEDRINSSLTTKVPLSSDIWEAWAKMRAALDWMSEIIALVQNQEAWDALNIVTVVTLAITIWYLAFNMATISTTTPWRISEKDKASSRKWLWVALVMSWILWVLIAEIPTEEILRENVLPKLTELFDILGRN